MAWRPTRAGHGQQLDGDSSTPPPGRTSAPVLDVRDVRVSYGAHTVLDGTSVQVAGGESVAVMGPSGSGKSTLLSVLLGLLKPDSGTVIVAGTPVRAGMGKTVSALRRDTIGMVFQAGHLLDELSPVENVMLPALVAGRPQTEARRTAEDLLSSLGVGGTERPVTQFSGGEQQRIALARALVNSPALVVADEPTGSLDPGNRDLVIDSLFSLPQRFGCAVLVVTHDPIVAAHAGRVLALRDGLLEVGDAQTAWTGSAR